MTLSQVLLAAAPMAIAGGALDPAHPGADVYLEAPRAAQAPSGRACRVAARYVALINAGDTLGAARLFADDATFLEPMRPSLHGRAAIDAFYSQQIGAMKPKIRAVSYLGDGRECMVALTRAVQLGGRERWVLVSVDHFIIGKDGKVASMAAFARPKRQL